MNLPPPHSTSARRPPRGPAPPVPAKSPSARTAPSLDTLDHLLACGTHHHATPSRNYGSRDPVADAVDFICACRCGSGPAERVFDFPDAAQLARQGGGPPGERRRRYFVECRGCARRGRSTVHDWAAVVEWNREHYDERMPIGRFPFFRLHGLTLEDAQERVKAIRHDLELRKVQAKRQSAAGIDTGRRYRERIEAYLGWTIAAASLLKAHARSRLSAQQPPAPEGARFAPGGAAHRVASRDEDR
jgi:hypothetical protein